MHLKDRHINISEDSRLMKLVYQQVESGLRINPRATALLLVLKFIVYFSLAAFFYVLLYTTEKPLFFFMAYTAFGLSTVLFGFNYAHDCSHSTVFRSKRLNSALFVLLYTLVGAHAEAWRYRHIHSHHYAPNVKEYDTDLQITSLIRVEPGSDWRWYHRFQHFYAPFAYMTYSVYWIFIKDFVIFLKDCRTVPGKSSVYQLSFWIQKAVYIGYLFLLPLFFSGFAWYLVLAAFLLMHAVQSLFLLFTFFMTHHVESTAYYTADHEGYIPSSWFMNQVKSSNDFYPFSSMANFIFGGFNNHVAHHLFPHVHHVHYPSLNRILYRVLRSEGIEPHVTGFFSGAWSHLKHLRKMSRKSG